jgi:hypothetical protein
LVAGLDGEIRVNGVVEADQGGGGRSGVGLSREAGVIGSVEVEVIGLSNWWRRGWSWVAALGELGATAASSRGRRGSGLRRAGCGGGLGARRSRSGGGRILHGGMKCLKRPVQKCEKGN